MKTKGVALISVMVAVAILTSMILFIAYDQEIDLSRTGRALEKQQAIMYAMGMEEWAKTFLNKDITENTYDAKTDAWYNKKMVFPVDGITLSGYFEPLQAKYNLNNLVWVWPANKVNARELTPKEKQAVEQEEQQLTKILQILELDKNTILAILDWLDPDDDARGQDTESNYYQNNAQPYKPANYILATLDEMKVIKGLDKENSELLDQLKKYLTVLPVRAPIDINLADEKLLLSLDAKLTTDMVKQLINMRDNQPNKAFTKLDDFYAALNKTKNTDKQNQSNTENTTETQQASQWKERIKPERISVSNDFFALYIKVAFGSTVYRVRSLIERVSQGDIRVIQRELIF